MSFIIDAAQHGQVTPANLKKIGADGAIVYAGCDAAWKNVTKAELHACLDAGFMMALVVENFATDLGKGRAEGQRQGANIVAAAKALGYDYENCVLFASADYDTRGAVVTTVGRDAMGGFGSEVPVPGIYGNSYLLDYCAANKTADVFWQSESLSFSNGTSPHAHFIQIYGDKRNQGLPLDINNVLRTPLRFMGEDMATPLTDADAAKVAAAVWEFQIQNATDPKTGKPTTAQARQFLTWEVGQFKAAALDIGKLRDAIAAQNIAGVDPAALAQALVEHLGINVVAK